MTAVVMEQVTMASMERCAFVCNKPTVTRVKQLYIQ